MWPSHRKQHNGEQYLEQYPVPEAPMFHVTLVPCLLFHSAFLTSFHFSLHGPFLQVFVPTMLDSLWWDVPSELSTIKGVSMTFSLLSQECSAEIAKFTCSARLKVGHRRACESIRSYPFLLLPLTPPSPSAPRPHGPHNLPHKLPRSFFCSFYTAHSYDP